MANYKVDTSRLNKDAGNIQGHIDRINQQMTVLQEAAAKLNEMWEGPARQAFHQVFLDDLSALSTLIRNLDKLYAYEANAKTKYEQCENRAINEVNRI